jgi:hypothetical protein
VQSDIRRRRHKDLNAGVRLCPWGTLAVLSIYTWFGYFVGMDGRAKLPNCKILVKPLAPGYVSVFETSYLM